MLTQCWGMPPTDEEIVRQALVVSASIMAIGLTATATATAVARRYAGPRILNALSRTALILGLLFGGLIIQLGYIAETVPSR